MMFAHFTPSKDSAESIIHDGIRLPLHLTTNLVLGPTYGKEMAFFIVDDDFECEVGFVGQGDLVNKKAEGCIEYVIRTPKQLNSFLDVVQRQGVSHAMHIKKYLESLDKKERKLHLGSSKVNNRKLKIA